MKKISLEEEEYINNLTRQEVLAVEQFSNEDSDACLLVGQIYLYGINNIPEDSKKSIKFLLRGAKKFDNKNCIMILKTIIEKGEISSKLLIKETEWILENA
jgi:TPR repeat protein